jgi:IS30 family transposase
MNNLKMFLNETIRRKFKPMEQGYCTPERKKHKHILRDDRYVIEQMLNAGQSKTAIIAVIGCTSKTLEREIERGTWEYMDSLGAIKPKYSHDVAQRIHEERAKNKGRYSKINDMPEFRSFVEKLIKKDKYSPEAALEQAKTEGFVVEISVKTLYNNIDSGEINVKRQDLLRKEGWKQDKSKPRKASNNLKGESIDNRPPEANDRSEYGHWEMDLIVSCKGGKGALLTLTERMTRQEIIIRLPDKTQRAVKRALDRLERRLGSSFKKKFRTITADNGSEFLDFESLQKSCKSNAQRFKMYYAHPYSSWERGSNENANGIIRRFLPKGTDFSKISTARIQVIEDWMNDYPRRILGGMSANMAAAIEAA